MRPIKFRAWDGEVMFIVREMAWLNRGLSVSDGASIDGVFELMQFTGLHDKNGLEIYEGDLLRRPNFESIWSVVWDDIHAGFLKLNSNAGRAMLDGGEEVIGNIWESPEPLTGGKEGV